MDIKGRIEFADADIESLTFTPAEKDPTAALVLSANFNPDIAELMRCRRSFYDDSGKPLPGPTRVDLGEKKLREVEVHLPSPSVAGQWDSYFPEMITGFRVDRDSEDAPLLRLHMRVRIQGRYEDLALFFSNTNKDSFEFAIRSRQDEFDWSGKDAGKKVDMAGPMGSPKDGEAEANGPLFTQEGDAECLHCQNDMPFNEETGKHMVNGEMADCARSTRFTSTQDEKVKEQVTGTLPRAAAVGAGRRKEKRPRPTAQEVDESTLGVAVQ